jgi:DNA-directed RNA polymerase subunit N (RpoN/RPB10)
MSESKLESTIIPELKELESQKIEYNDMTLFPVRCYTCRTVIGNKQQMYKKLLDSGLSISEALNKMEIKRTCCRINITSVPQVPLSVALNSSDADIVQLYNKFVIKDDSPLETGVINSTTIINTTTDPKYNSVSLNQSERPRRVYSLTKRDPITKRIIKS